MGHLPKDTRQHVNGSLSTVWGIQTNGDNVQVLCRIHKLRAYRHVCTEWSNNTVCSSG